MSDVTHAAIAKTKILKALCEQWTLEISEIKSPETEYREKRQVLLRNYDKEICQLGKHSPDTNEYARRSDAVLKFAGDLRELDIEYHSSVALLERQFAERLETANKRLACDSFQTLGDTLWDHSVSTVLHQCLSSKTPMVADTGVKEGSKALLEARSEKESNLNITAETLIDLESGQNQSLLPVTGNSKHQDRALAQAPALTKARVLVQSETMDHSQVTLHQTPIQEREPALQSNLVTDGQGATSPVAIQASTPNRTTDASRLSENVVDPQARSSSRAMPASETNLDQNGGRACLDMWPSSQIPNQSASFVKGTETLNNNPGEEWTDSLVAHLRAPLKRLQAEASNRKHKRQKPPIEPLKIPEEQVISFDQVFQDGNAQIKYIIVQHPPELGHWYILECKEHNKHFYQDPIQGATRHLIGQEHGISGDHSLAVKMLGARVLDCNEKLAAKTIGNRTKEYLTQEVGIIPVVGEVYAARYPTKSHTCAVLVLPWTAFDHFPRMKQLLRDTPACFLFDKTVDQCPRGWAKGYEDGGHRFKERAYPVVYFHKDKFPEQCNVGWVPITSFKAYNPGHTEVVFPRIVDQYLRNKDPRLTANHGYSTANSIVIPDDNDHEDAHMEHGNGEMSGNASRNESRLRLKDKRLVENTKLQAESSTADLKTSYNSPSQGDGTVVPRSQTHTQEPTTTPGQMARIEYPFVSGGSEDVEKAGSTTGHVATSTSKQPIVNLAELGEVHADSAFNRPAPRNEDTYSRVSLRPS
ncbi:uncharacterized protein FTJAE_4242 [Fusarium tjaetaba]|uniref:Uncharacterized protein n=1 Tax=Fusarium tjaetaba TaxID=1567544 RepID=A0A8H5W0D5_9HYPO|nr:uncharacterized protein FTJAE_4242 [Fusarium tjaetaba]KAF5641060.1 hypothetical protein FTJAE_4242 [Fusarium tjaetaba]